MKMYAIIKISDGVPNINLSKYDIINDDGTRTPTVSYILSSKIANWGLYLLSSEPSILLELSELGNVIALARQKTKIPDDQLVTGEENNNLNRWKSLDDNFPSDILSKINNWITNHRPNWDLLTENDKPRHIIRLFGRKMKNTWEFIEYEIDDKSLGIK